MTETVIDGQTELWERVEAALDQVRPGIHLHGGDVELAGIREGVASIRMTGACVGCPLSQMTMQMGIEYVIRENVPEIVEVVALPWEEDDLF